jgi:integrase
VPLKSRKGGDYRDVPVPGWLWQMVKDLPAGPLCPGRERRYMTYRTQQKKFQSEAAKAGIPAGFTPHSLRHAYASALLARRVPISDLAVWLGHRDINTTYATYGHLVPSALGQAVAALDAEYAGWVDRETR